MCGINGILSNNENFSIEESLRKMNQLIIHRGPNQEGLFFDNNEKYSIGMAMRRLSIVDLQTGNQPIYSEDKQKVIVFNGEIYNYKKLRNELKEIDTPFTSNSDTEVILKLYEKYGVKSFSMLDGMFAFSIFDKKINKLFVARDFFGEKPLYFYEKSGLFIWASELKSILSIMPQTPPINKTALNLFFQLTYIPAPYTIYESIHKLEANHYIEFDCASFNFQTHEILHSLKKHTLETKPELIKTTHDLVQESVNSRSHADVSLGTFLSGGVDSSIVSLCLSKHTNTKIETFSIGFEKKSFDETNKSRKVAKIINSNHHEFIISEKDITKDIDDILLNFDEPFADSSALSTYIVSKKAKSKVKVALTGDGGDEVFGGYNKYYMGILNQKYTNIVPHTLHINLERGLNFLINSKEDKRGLGFKLKKMMTSIDYNSDFYYKIISLGFQENQLKCVLNPDFFVNDSLSYFKQKIGKNKKSITDFRNIDKLISLEGDMLVKVDRTSMLNSLECRAPFLNKEIWNFTNQIPEEYLIKGFNKKHILKESFKKYFPINFFNQPKKGFEVPVGDWLRDGLSDELNSFIEQSFIRKQEIFKFEAISKLVNDHLNGRVDNTFQVWSFYCFQKWYKKNY
jgi:asparagine synthase (glutamine-hydrolysing)